MIREFNVSDKKYVEAFVRELDENFSFSFENPFREILIYEEDCIKGIISYSVIYERIEIDYIYVLEKERNKGIGSALVKSMIKKEKDILSVSLEVKVDNEDAIIFYKKFGFVEKEIKKNYYKGIDGLLLVKELWLWKMM